MRRTGRRSASPEYDDHPMHLRLTRNYLRALLLCSLLIVSNGCRQETASLPPVLTWYVFDEPSGAFRSAAAACTQQAAGRYRIALTPLPADTDQQREQLVRRLAAEDADIDIIGMDVIWTAEFAEAGWLLPWPVAAADRMQQGRLLPALQSARYKNLLWAAPFTSNVQLLWYRSDMIQTPPRTWQALLYQAEAIGKPGTLQVQGQRYEGLTVFFVSLLASAGGSVLNRDGSAVSLATQPTVTALMLMQQIARSTAADPALNTAREDQTRLVFESGLPAFMINYSYVWPSAQQNAPHVAQHMAFARWPAVRSDLPSRVTLGGINLGIGAYTRHPTEAYAAVECLTSAKNQIIAATLGGLPPTLEGLYDAPEVRQRFPFADTLRDSLRDAVLRPQTPLYNDISLAITRTLHPLHAIEPQQTAVKLREAIDRALHSEGLL